MKKISFTVPGEPRGKARPKVTRTKAGKSLTYTPDKTVAYEELVRQRYLQASGGDRFPDGVPLALFVRAFYGIPKSTSKRKRASAYEKARLRQRFQNPVRCAERHRLRRRRADRAGVDPQELHAVRPACGGEHPCNSSRWP